MEADPGAAGVQDVMQRLLEHPLPEVRELTETLLQGIDGIHRPALIRLANLLDHHGLLQAAAGDEVVRQVLDLYDLLPQTPEDLVQRALEDVRPYIQSHGGQLEVLAIDGGVVRVRLAGACSGCSGSAITLRRGVETALKAGYPGFERMEVEQPAPQPARPTFIPLGEVRSIRPAVRPIFTDVAAVEDVQGMQLLTVGDEEVLLHNLNGEIFAFKRGGESREAFPVAVENGRVKVAVNVPAEAPLPR
jgi:Fe-S cluster biogenesis protein NfuA